MSNLKKRMDDIKEFNIWEKYEKLEKLGTGTYGKVYRSRNKETNEECAVKKMLLKKDVDGIHYTILRELAILRKVSHVNIVRLIDVSMTMNSFSIVMEYLPRNLEKFIYDPRVIMDPKIICSYSFQLLAGVYYLHSHQIIHRDIKARNILINSKGHLKICDFGLSRFFTVPIRQLTQGVATLNYRSPELLCHNQFYDISIDIWSCGCVIAEMLLRRPLFLGDSDIDMIHKIMQLLGTPDETVLSKLNDIAIHKIEIPNYPGQDLASIIPTTDMYLIDLIKKMLEIDPQKRISAKEALQHPYFNPISQSIRNFCIPGGL